MLLQFMSSIIGQLAINEERDIFSYPFTLHSSCPLGGKSLNFMWGQPPSAVRRAQPGFLFISYPPTARATSAWLETKYSLPSLPWYAKSRPRFATSIRDNASAQRPCARAALTFPARRI